MVYDLKYHLTTIVAIFLALAIGILIGSSIIGGTSGKQLEKELNKILAENSQQTQQLNALNDQMDLHNQFEKAAAPALVDNKLWGRNIAIIQTGDYVEATQSTKAILEDAGAQITSITTIHNLRADTSRDRMTQALEDIIGVSPTDADPTNKIVGLVADSIANGSNIRAVHILEDKGLLSASGNYDKRVTHVIIVGGSKEPNVKVQTLIDPMLIDKLKNSGVSTIVGVEPVDVGTSYIPAYHLKQIPTVDNVDQYMGQVGLVYAINGENGHFGVKSTADRVAPEFFEQGLWHRGKRR